MPPFPNKLGTEVLPKMMVQTQKILIVGGGLAGCFAAANLALSGHRISLVDVYTPKSASRVAAGLFNVVTGREANKTWMADEMLAAIHSFLAHPAFASLAKFIHFMPIYRPYQDGYSYNEWMVKLQEPDFAAVGTHLGTPQLPHLLNNPIGGLRIESCGWAEVEPLCNGILEILRQDFGLQQFSEVLLYSQLDPQTGCVQEHAAAGNYDHILFAEGLRIMQNPWFDFVHIKPLKGQVLNILVAPGLDEGQVYLRKNFLIPKGQGQYTAGSTYELHFEDDEPNAEGIENVLQSVRDQTTLSVTLVEARASIRPTTPNRRPILGRHPEFPKLIAFNGLGTKGVLQAPMMAEMLRKWLDGDLEAIPKEVSLDRFMKKNP